MVRAAVLAPATSGVGVTLEAAPVAVPPQPAKVTVNAAASKAPSQLGV
jgi:hypothetical protein